MERIDSGLMAIAIEQGGYGDLSAFGGLVPLREGDRTDWRAIAARRTDDVDAIVHMPLGALESFLLVHLDGATGFDRLVTLSCCSAADVLSALDELEWVGLVEPSV